MLEYATTIKHISNTPIDVHLMVKQPKSQIDNYIDLNPNYITIHYEAFEDNTELLNSLSYIKQNGIKVGLSIKPNTRIEDIYEYLDKVNLVLIMTVEPGYGGQTLIEGTIEKIRNLKKYVSQKDLECFIEADGGINLGNIKALEEAGVDIAVVGSAIINSDNMKETIKCLKT